jgi:aspartate 1-decarboxylase
LHLKNIVELIMNIEVVKSKIHRVRITGSDLNYIGSITIDEDLMDAANIIEGEKVHIVNINNGERFITYAIKGVRKSGDIVLNGPAARRVAKDDIIIIISYASMDFEEAKSFKPSIVFPNEKDNSLT